MFSKKDETVGLRAELQKLSGVSINSRWLDETVSSTTTIHTLEPSGYIGPAIDDVEDIRNCDVFVVFTVDGDTPTRRGGRHWETGFAYGIGKPVFICGPKENIFHFLPDVKVCGTLEQLKQELLKFKYDRYKTQINAGYFGGITGAEYPQGRSR